MRTTIIIVTISLVFLFFNCRKEEKHDYREVILGSYRCIHNDDEYDDTKNPSVFKKIYIDTLIISMSTDSAITIGGVLFHILRDYTIETNCFPSCHTIGYIRNDSMYYNTWVPWGNQVTTGTKLK